MTTQTLSQMNIRLDSDTKRAGDAVLAGAGVTPTELIRQLWQKVAQGADDLRQVEEVLAGTSPAVIAKQPASPDKLIAMQRGRELFAQGLRELGVSTATTLQFADAEDDRDTYVAALVDRMAEREVW